MLYILAGAGPEKMGWGALATPGHHARTALEIQATQVLTSKRLEGSRVLQCILNSYMHHTGP